MEVARGEAYFERERGSSRIASFPAKKDVAALVAHCRTTAAGTGEKASLVVYETGVARLPAKRRIVTGQILVQVADEADARDLAVAHGATIKRPAIDLPGYFILEIRDALGCFSAVSEMRGHPKVISAEPLLARQQQKRSVPNDTLIGDQWHLHNTGQNGGVAGIDANVINVWGTFGGAGTRGAGVTIGIVDDGLEVTHPDLAPNVDTTIDFDWNDGTPNDPSPDLGSDFHGTAVAGVAAARGNNSLGVSGAAPEATLVGLRLVATSTTDDDEAGAMLHRNDVIDIKSNSWGPSDDGETVEGPGVLLEAAFLDAATNGRGGLGTILVWSAGNAQQNEDNANKDGFANSIYTVAVGAIDDQGTHTFYSEEGACLVVTAPSHNFSGQQMITTTDLTGSNGYQSGDYANDFGGTSSSTPLVAGVIALLLDVNPGLGWRDVQEILIASATKVDASDTDWVVNGGGFNFNHKYGAGLVNAQGGVGLASGWTNLAPQSSSTVSHAALGAAIPDNNSTGIDVVFDFSATDMRVEHVTIAVDITHKKRGHLAVTLTSPDNTVSRLVESHGDNGDHYSDWTFMTVANWGEDSMGIWTLNVADLQGGESGTLNSAEVTLYGAPSTYRIEGTVTDKASGDPLPGVAVTAAAANLITGVTGGYQFDGLAAGSYNVTATLADYTSDAAMVNLGPDATNIDFGLRGPLNLLDPDLDGAVNLQETAFFMNHLEPDAERLPQVTFADVSGTEYPAVSYHRLKGGAGTAGVDYVIDGITYLVEISHDLQTWVSGAAEVELVSVTDDGNGVSETVVVRPEVLPSELRTYFRVITTWTPLP